MRCLWPEEVTGEETIPTMHVFLRYGFLSVEVPALEKYSLLWVNKYGDRIVYSAMNDGSGVRSTRLVFLYRIIRILNSRTLRYPERNSTLRYHEYSSQGYKVLG